MVVAVLAAAAMLGGAAPAGAWGSAPVVGKPAPGFTAVTLDGKKISLDDYKGQVLVINFWATWCGPCKRELPLLDAYYRIQEKNGLKVIAVTTEDSLPAWQLKPLAKVLTIPLVRYMHGSYATPDGVPTNYVVDRAGVLRYAKAGAFDLDAMNEVLVPLLQEPAPAPTAPATTAGAMSPASPAG